MTGQREVEIKKRDEEQQIVFGEVYAPNVPDSQGDYMSAAEIQKAAYKFMQRGLQLKIDTDHNRQVNGSFVVESFIAREGDPVFIPGSWVVGVHVPDNRVWSRIKSGELNGFSFDGLAVREPRTIEIDIPDELSGMTDQVSGHEHTFMVKFDAATGDFLGGQTDTVDGHYHTIAKGTVTEMSKGHSHRFSFVEGFARAQG